MESFNEDWTVDVAAKLHKYRITQARLAEAAGYSVNYVSQIMNGKKARRSDKSFAATRDRICKALDALIAEQEQRVETA